MKQKVFFIIFKGLSVGKNCLRPDSVPFIFFLLNIISCACLLGSGFKLIFHWKAQLLINFKSFLTSLTEVLKLLATENKVSLAKMLHWHHKIYNGLEKKKHFSNHMLFEKCNFFPNNFYWLLKQFGKSLIHIKNNRGPRMEPCGTTRGISSQTNTGHIKLTFVFCCSRNHLVYQSSLYIYPLDTVC